MIFVLLLLGGSPLALGEEPSGEAPAYRLREQDMAPFRLPAGAGERTGDPSRRSADASPPPHLEGAPFAKEIQAAALRASVDPALVHALIFVESRYNPLARSPKGALGLMQLLPETARRYGVPHAVREPSANLRAGTHYLRDLLTIFDDRLDLALAAYNAGENAVLRYGNRIPPYPETRAYVPAVLARYRELKAAEPPPRPARVTYMPGTRLNLDSPSPDRR